LAAGIHLLSGKILMEHGIKAAFDFAGADFFLPF
jgi:hypothetical protein